jgi:hypothetical protein
MTIGELIVKLGLEGQAYTSGLANAERATKTGTGNIGKHFDEAGKKAGAFHNVMTGIGQGIGQATFGLAEKGLSAVKDAISGASAAYKDMQVSTAKLDTALKNSVPAYTGNDDAINAVISSGTKLGFSADEQRASLALLVGTTHDVAGAQKAQAAAMDLARLKGIDLATATAAIMGAEAGRTASLKKLGIEVTKGMTNEQLLASITKTAGGQAASYAATDAGKQAAAHERVTEALVKVGKVISQVSTVVMPILADAFGNIVDAVSPLLDQLGQEMPAILDTARGAFSQISGAVSSVSDAIMPLVSQAFTPLMAVVQDISSDGDKLAAVLAIIGGVVLVTVVPPFVTWAAATIAAAAPIIAIGVAVAAVVIILDKLGILKVIGATMKDLAAKIMPALKVAFGIVSTAVGAVAKVIGNVVSAVLPPLKTAFGIFTDTILPALGTAFTAISTVVGTVFGAIAGIIKTNLNIVISAINILIGALDAIQIHIPSFGIGPINTPAVDWNGLGLPPIPTLHSGGVVPGTPGTDVLALLQAGETVTARGASGGITVGDINLYGVGSDVSPAAAQRFGTQIRDAIAKALQEDGARFSEWGGSRA